MDLIFTTWEWGDLESFVNVLLKNGYKVSMEDVSKSPLEQKRYIYVEAVDKETLTGQQLKLVFDTKEYK